MAITSPEGLRTFLLVCETEVQSIQKEANSLPAKVERLAMLVADQDLHESCCESIAFRISRTTGCRWGAGLREKVYI